MLRHKIRFKKHGEGAVKSQTALSVIGENNEQNDI